MQRTRTAALLFVLIFVITTFLDVAKADGHQTESFDISYLYPLGAALVVAGLMWKFLSQFN